MLTTLYPIILFFIAGIIGGSYAIPTKHIKIWKFENIWLQHSLWAFIIFPLISSYIFCPNILQILHLLSYKLITFIIISGLLYGIGQIFSAFAINSIGISFAFTIGIAVNTIFGSLLPLLIQYPNKLLTKFGIFTLIGILVAFVGFVFSILAGNKKNIPNIIVKNKYKNAIINNKGVIFAILSGIFVAGQNICFSFTNNEIQALALKTGTSRFGSTIIIWPIFLMATFIPYAIYMFYLLIKNRSINNYFHYEKNLKYYFFTFIMGFFWFMSLLLYSNAVQLLGHLGPIIGWPIFMLLNILTANAWGWIYNEWKNLLYSKLYYLIASLLLLSTSIIILSISSYFI